MLFICLFSLYPAQLSDILFLESESFSWPWLPFQTISALLSLVVSLCALGHSSVTVFICLCILLISSLEFRTRGEVWLPMPGPCDYSVPPQRVLVKSTELPASPPVE